ncbi:MAG TPA: 2-oxo acid dehydrogenase subunit E2 [Chthonomonadaceae bacterium]|nr:2-oxo acid dehydrogenase subunit E2 [Chthonomonadaceae bacterium]
MAIVDIPIPQMGEGLQEVILLGFHKKPGDHVKRDEPLYSMETDKAVMEVESPYEGVLKEWLAEEGAVLAIGAPVARMETEDVEALATSAPSATAAVTAETLPEEPAARSETVIPPRTRAYCREKGLSEEEMRRIPAPTGKLLPADVDAYLKAKGEAEARARAEGAEAEAKPYVEHALSQHHRTFIYRLRRSMQIVVPATARRSVEWGRIRRFAEGIRAQGGPLQPSSFQCFAYCVVQAVKEHPKFRSALIGDTTIREYRHVNIGIAVAVPEGELNTAVVQEADTLDFPAFIQAAQANIQRAREGEDQARQNTQLLLTYMGPYEIVDAVPVLVAPAAAVLFIGSPYEQNGELITNLALTFDHRLIQGIEAAEFLRAIAEKTRQIEQIAST